jgi:hypothetical protein
MLVVTTDIVMAGHVARMGDICNACKILIRKSEAKRPPGRRRWENNIKIGLEIRWALNLFGPEYGPVMSSFEHGNEPSVSIKCGEFLDKLREHRFF